MNDDSYNEEEPWSEYDRRIQEEKERKEQWEKHGGEPPQVKLQWKFSFEQIGSFFKRLFGRK